VASLVRNAASNTVVRCTPAAAADLTSASTGSAFAGSPMRLRRSPASAPSAAVGRGGRIADFGVEITGRSNHNVDPGAAEDASRGCPGRPADMAAASTWGDRAAAMARLSCTRARLAGLRVRLQGSEARRADLLATLRSREALVRKLRLEFADASSAGLVAPEKRLPMEAGDAAKDSGTGEVAGRPPSPHEPSREVRPDAQKCPADVADIPVASLIEELRASRDLQRASLVAASAAAMEALDAVVCAQGLLRRTSADVGKAACPT